MTSSLAPGLLLAVPQLVSPIFYRNVIFLLENDSKGSTGLVLNNPTQQSVAELNDALKMCRRRDEAVFVGGPVDLSLGFILHEDRYRGPDTKPIAEGLSVSTTLESMKAISNDTNLTFRCFIGYAGWGPGQLESEIADGTWLTCSFVLDFVFTDEPAKLWETVLRHMGIDPMSLGPGGGVQ